MKKSISITLAAALLSAVLAGCAKTENSGSNAAGGAPAQTAENAPETAAPTAESAAPAPTEEASLPVGSTVIADWAENVRLGDSFTEFTADESEYQSRVVFTTDGAVSDFKLLALTYVDSDNEGHLIFDAEEVYTQPALTADLPLVVNLTFVGEIPGYGISYDSGTGEVWRFSLNVSGFDGSLVLSEF